MLKHGHATPSGSACSHVIEVIVIDGTAACPNRHTAAADLPRNLMIVAIDNNAYGSRNQPTLRNMRRSQRYAGSGSEYGESGKRKQVEAMKTAKGLTLFTPRDSGTRTC
jgi:hypothetical protein